MEKNWPTVPLHGNPGGLTRRRKLPESVTRMPDFEEEN
jgi:hypothetical protein